MNKVIWKYEIGDGVTELTMPATAQVLSFRAQPVKSLIWALVDPEEVTRIRTFAIYGTGHSIRNTPHIIFIGTSFYESEVWHCFEITDKP